MKQRIWELDALRGLCILAVLVFHLIFDLVEVFGLIRWQYPEWFVLVRDWGGVVFLVLSGICVTLGTKSTRRGLIVLGSGMVCTAVTVGMTFFGFHHSIIIYFGVLHCLGTCMLLWPLFKKCPWWALLPLGLAVIGLGFWSQTLRVETPWLIPFGLMYPGFSSSDYFPLLPHLGFFLLGAVLGKTLYREKKSLLPKAQTASLIRPLTFCGRHSLWIYLLHQPVLYGICWAITMIS